MQPSWQQSPFLPMFQRMDQMDLKYQFDLQQMLGARLAPTGALFAEERQARNSFDLNERSAELFKPHDEKGFSLMPLASEGLIIDDVKFTNEDGLHSLNDNNQPHAATDF